MASIVATNLCIDFPLYGVSSRSFKTSLITGTVGGIFNKNLVKDKVIVRALDNVSFEINNGDRVGLIGHNGSGKTTLLRAIIGAYESTHGEIRVRGRISSMLDIYLGMNDHSTGLENVYLRAHIMEVSKHELKDFVSRVVDFSELGDFINIPLRAYSSGMKMRLAFSISTIIKSEIVIMDEWMSVGDSDFQDKARKKLDEYIDGASIVVLASHDESLVERECNRVFLLKKGKLIERK